MTQDSTDMDPVGPETGAPDFETLQRERDDLKDRLLRSAAEFDNYRKRVDRERRELAEFASADLIRDLLPVIDDFDRALASPSWPATDPARQGIELIQRRLLEVLRRRGVEPLEVLGQDFNPEWHETIGAEPAPGKRDGEIIAEVRRGYRLGGKLLRAALVKVAQS